MTLIDILNLSITEKDNTSFLYSLVKQANINFQLSQTAWSSEYVVPVTLTQVPLPVNPVIFAYVRNIGQAAVGIEVMPATSSSGGGTPALVPVTLIAPGGIFLSATPKPDGVFIGGAFPATITYGIQQVWIQGNGLNNGFIEYFFGG